MIYVHQSTLFAVPFDLHRLALAGAAAPVLEEVSNSSSGAHFALSQSGTLVYVSGIGQIGWAIS